MYMIEQIKNVMVHSGTAWVLLLLAVLSIASIAVMLDRARAFWGQTGDVADLALAVPRSLESGDREAAQAHLARSSSMAAVAGLAGLARFDAGSRAVEEAIGAAVGLERARLERHLLFLGTVGNNAPFVGLLGTVIGVVGAFDELGRSSVGAAATALAPERVMGTISEALVATAVGLVVALPAVLVFNHYQGRLARATADAETLAHVLQTHAASETRRSGTHRAADLPAIAVGVRN
jgi:biopolymer transport protein ExbB